MNKRNIYELLNNTNQNNYEIDVIDPDCDYEDKDRECWDDEIYND